MSGVNKAIILGNLGSDPELKVLESGTQVCRLSVATTRSWMNKQTSERQSETEWHRVTVWGKQAESCNTYLSKGRQVYVEGRLRTSSYDDGNGGKKFSTEIVAETVQFVGSRDSAPRQDNVGGENQPAPNPGKATQDDDDIPF